MTGISFIYEYLKSGQAAREALHLRLEPNNVSWSYNLNTFIQDTYGGQVIQLLSVNIDRLVVEGQFGKEGVFGTKFGSTGDIDRHGYQMPFNGLMPKGRDEQWDDRTGKYGVGLTQMTEFFRNYFARSSQGGDAVAPGRYQFLPMRVTYLNRSWGQLIPVDFPSYKRSNENFAPEWHIEFEVVEADEDIASAEFNKAKERLQNLIDGVGYKARNPFSDPLADNIDPSQSGEILTQIASNFRNMVPGFTRGELEDMIWKGISVPAVTEYRGVDPSLLNPNEAQDPQRPYLKRTEGGTR